MIFSKNTMIRLISSLILIPVVVGIILAGGAWFMAFLCLAFGIAAVEWFKLSKATNQFILFFPVGIIYCLISCSEFMYLRVMMADGAFLVLLCFFMVWGSDTGAYIAGKNFGGALMSPTISPKKTWSGMVGAIVGASIVFTAGLYLAPHIGSFIPTTMNPTWAELPMFIILGGAMGYVGQIGDLLVSALKRKAHAKDSGHLIPGHGGILDRIDSLLLIIPVFLVVARYVLR